MDWNERQRIWHRKKYHSNIEAGRAKAREYVFKNRYKDTLAYGDLAKEVDRFLKAAEVIIENDRSVMDELLERLVFRMKNL
jgi:hypothetical protein